jgi:hypothetical protein
MGPAPRARVGALVGAAFGVAVGTQAPGFCHIDNERPCFTKLTGVAVFGVIPATSSA